MSFQNSKFLQNLFYFKILNNVKELENKELYNMEGNIEDERLIALKNYYENYVYEGSNEIDGIEIQTSW